MAEQTTPETGVEQAPSDPLARMQSFLSQSEDNETEAETPAEPEQAETVEQPEGQADELTPDDIPDEPVTQPAVDAFEIVHNGTQHKLTREETIKYAQQGFDYTQKTQAVAEQQRQVSERLQRLAELEQVQPVLAQEMAQVSALEAQLRQYQSVDWVSLATNDPLEYPKYRAQYDTLVNAYQGAVGQLQHKATAVNQHKQQLTAQLLQQEVARLPEVIPEWKNAERAEADKKAMHKYLSETGADMNQIGRYLDNAVAMKMVLQSMRYEQLQKAKAEKVKQLRPLPPVTRPGAPSRPAQAEKEMEARKKLRSSGSALDAAAVLLNRMK